jgi:hypothetical protein
MLHEPHDYFELFWVRHIPPPGPSHDLGLTVGASGSPPGRPSHDFWLILGASGSHQGGPHVT